MHKINEEVKKQIEIWQKNPDVYLGQGKGYRKMTVDDLVEQISRLIEPPCKKHLVAVKTGLCLHCGEKIAKPIPKNLGIDSPILIEPDESRLLTYGEFVKEYGKRPADIAFNMAVRLTASIKDAECQQELEKVVEEIFRKTENLWVKAITDEDGVKWLSVKEPDWEALKQDILKKVGEK